MLFYMVFTNVFNNKYGEKIDVENTIIPYISYDSINHNINIEKEMDLGNNDVICNFMLFLY